MKRTLLVILCLVLVAAGAAMYLDGAETISGGITTMAEQPDLEPEPEPEPAIPMVSVPLSSLTDTGYLKLVNRDLAVRRFPSYYLLTSAWPTVPVRATDILLHQTALAAISALLYDGQDVGSFFVSSGYRSEVTQCELYSNAVNRMYVLPPRHSEHHLGLAADILAIGIPMNEMSGTTEANWLAQNAWRHGLILRYPSGTTHITGVAYEPWHFRYVGGIHAWRITQNEMVLEEYLEYLYLTGGFSAELNGVQYHVMYIRPSVGGYVYVPRYLQFRLSASNRGGYVITAWE